MSQSRLHSFVEAWANVFIGYWINFAMNMLILPLYGFHITLTQNLSMGLLYTMVSVIRSYVLRRWFNNIIRKKIV